MIPYAEIHYHNEYKQLAAVVGKSKLGQEFWDEWARLQEKYGWKLLIRAADRCEPLNRWPPNCEVICMQLQKDEKEAQAEWQAKNTPPAKITPERRAELARLAQQLFSAVKEHRP